MNTNPSQVVPPEDETSLSEDDRQKRRATEIKRCASVSGFEVLDQDGHPLPGVKGWREMPPEARAAACVAAIFAGFPLDTRILFYVPGARVAFAIQPDPNVLGVRKGAGRSVPRTIREAIAPAVAAYGTRGAAIEQFIKRRS